MNNTQNHGLDNNKTKSMISKKEFDTLKEFLFNGKSDWYYPEIQENDYLLYFLSGVAIKTMLEKSLGEDKAFRFMYAYTEVKDFNSIKKHALDLFRKSSLYFPYGDKTPMWKSLFVILSSEPRCLKEDCNLYFCYFAGLMDEVYVKQIVEYMID